VSRSVPLFQVDAFSAEPFRGNPAAVCLLDAAVEASWMQAIAAEMNLAETAFVVPRADGYDLRWFTPACEVDLCGHATLASAHVLWSTGRLAPGATARFLTKSGWLSAAQQGDLTELDFPATPPTDAPEAAAALAEAIGADVRWTGRSAFDLMARVDVAATVRRLTPDMPKVQAFPVRGVIVTAPGDDGRHDFVSRFFGPQSGVPEDPVTGSAHCALAPYWSAELGRDTLLGYQASPRGGSVRTRLSGDRVLLGGRAVTVFTGTLLV
jgi:PhzF family phenazine biosynthesis protein